MKRRFLKSVGLWALAHYLALMCLEGVMFLASHLPPKAVNLDGMILALQYVEELLTAPRRFLLWLYPWETTPAGLGIFLTVVNSLTWGLAATCLKRLWDRARR